MNRGIPISGNHHVDAGEMLWKSEELLRKHWDKWCWENCGKCWQGSGETGRRFVEHVGNMLETSEYVGNKVGKTIKHHPTGIYLMAENTSWNCIFEKAPFQSKPKGDFSSENWDTKLDQFWSFGGGLGISQAQSFSMVLGWSSHLPKQIFSQM